MSRTFLVVNTLMRCFAAILVLGNALYTERRVVMGTTRYRSHWLPESTATLFSQLLHLSRQGYPRPRSD